MEVYVIGGGASGMMAALTAAEKPRCRVHLLERQSRPARLPLCICFCFSDQTSGTLISTSWPHSAERAIPSMIA